MSTEKLDAIEGDSSRAASPEQFSALTWGEVRPLLAAARRLQAAQKAWAALNERSPRDGGDEAIDAWWDRTTAARAALAAALEGSEGVIRWALGDA